MGFSESMTCGVNGKYITFESFNGMIQLFLIYFNCHLCDFGKKIMQNMGYTKLCIQNLPGVLRKLNSVPKHLN
jgi:hypothetical protein